MNWDIVLGMALGQGGLERVVATVGRTLRRRGHGVRILQAGPSPYPWAQGLPLVHYDPLAGGGAPRYAGEPDVLRWAHGYRAICDTGGPPDVILATHTPFFSLIARLAAGIGPHAPVILSWIHGPPSAYGDLSPLRCADAHLAISRSVEDRLRAADGGEVGRPVFYVGNPVSLAVPPVGRPRTGAHFVFMGRISPEKRLDRLLEEIAHVQAPWRLSVYGEGPLKEEMQALAASLGIAHRVAWHGWRRDPFAALADATALLLTSEYEGFGSSAAEALAHGVPVISSRSGGPEELLRDGGGWLYPGHEAGALAAILEGIAAGRLPLPTQEECRRQVRSYAPGLVVDRIEAAALSARAVAAMR